MTSRNNFGHLHILVVIVLIQDNVRPRVRQVGRAVEGARLKERPEFGKCSGPQLWAWVRIPHLTFETNLVILHE